MGLTKAQRRLVVFASVIVGITYFLPIWQLDIQAPQYPEGLGMTIWLSHMTGNLAQINLLNHYIGMKHITPSSIPELRFMPGVVLGLAGLGTVAAAINRRWALGTWLTLLLSSGLFGLYDFYRWGYDYGHQLNPHAPIRVPGMSYQPPLIGHKHLLNIDAYSYPSIGGVAIGIAALLALFVLIGSKSSRKTRAAPLMLVLGILGFATGVTTLSACNTPPQPIHPGLDHCQMCEMTISNDRYGGELITSKGKVYKFDSLQCLAKFYFPIRSQIKSVLASDFLDPGKLVPVEKADFLYSKNLHAPMGPGLVASTDEHGLRALKQKLTGEELNWTSALKLLQSS